MTQHRNSAEMTPEMTRLYEAGTPQLLRRALVGDCETPVAAFLKLDDKARGPAFLLESVEGGATRGRYSMIGLDPALRQWTLRHPA